VILIRLVGGHKAVSQRSFTQVEKMPQSLEQAASVSLCCVIA
jgi:hypothetical protein